MFLNFITDNFLRSIVGSRLSIMTPSAKNSDIPSLERRDDPAGGAYQRDRRLFGTDPSGP